MIERRVRLVAVAGTIVAVLSLTAASVVSQTPPPRPRLLFSAADIPALQAKVSAPGTASNAAWDQMVTTASWVTTGGQGSFVTYRSLRRMTEAAARYAIEGNVSSGVSARNVLLQACGWLVPTGEPAYQASSYPCALAATYDLVRPLLSSSQRATVVSHLEAWVAAMKAGSNSVGSFSNYLSATDNHSFAWSAGIAFTLMGIWGDSNLPNIVQDIDHYLDYVEDGWRDPVSPDGSVDESYGYMSYGLLYSIHAGIAGERCGFGDRFSNANILGVPRWLAHSIIGDSFPWIGDHSPEHKGLRMDPIVHYLAGRAMDAEGLWGLDRIFALEPVGEGSVSWAFSPYLNMALHYPEGLTPTPPAVPSAFFRDNKNLAPGYLNKVGNNSEVGDGGTALMHNGLPGQGAVPFDVAYIIRDEWMTHNHEDDGHLCIAWNGRKHVIDRGYADQGSGYSGAQSLDHNIVTTQGVPPFAGSGSNYYSPPPVDGRFYGRCEARSFTPALDFVRGDHSNMWQMEVGTRTTLLVKDPVDPYLVVLDLTRRDGGTWTYEQRWNTTAPMTGLGTLQSFYQVNFGGAVLKSTYLSPAAPTHVSDGSSTNQSITWHANRIVATATGGQVFLNVWHGAALQALQALPTPAPNTVGGIFVIGGYTDKLLATLDTNPGSDAITSTDGRLLWIRSGSTAITSWFASEATTAVHDGITLLTSSEPLLVTVGSGRVDLVRPVGSTGTGTPQVTLTVPGTITEVTLGGQPVAFTQTGATVTVGSNAPPGPQVPVSSDRFYTFSDENLRDGLLIGPATLDAEGTLVKTGSSPQPAVFLPRGGGANASRPLYVAVDVKPSSQVAGLVGALPFGTQPGLSNLFSVEILSYAGQVMLLQLLTPTGTPLLVQHLDVTAPDTYRVGVIYDPVSGTASLLDRQGRVVLTSSVPGTSAPFYTSLVLTGGAAFDNYALYDSEEDGTTPQGVVVWVLDSGRIGWSVQAPGLGLGGLLDMQVGTLHLPPATLAAIMSALGFQEYLAQPVLLANGFLAPTQREMCWESMPGLLVPELGLPYIVRYFGLTGIFLTGGTIN